MRDQDTNRSVEIPRWFLAGTAPRIREMAEMQVMLAYFRLADSEQDQARPVPESTMLRDRELRDALKLEGAVQPPDVQIRRGIELAVARETLLEFKVDQEDGSATSWLLLATEQNRILLERYRSGELEPPADPETGAKASAVERARPGVFKLYEQNIGLVTPIIADRLVEALELYPQSWIEDAIEAAVSYNKRNWRYVQRILETWATEGRSHETNRRNQPTSGDLDPERHLSGEYAAIFRRRRRE